MQTWCGPGATVRSGWLAGFAANHQIADFRHVFHGESDTFAAQTTVLDPAIRHIVDPIGRHIIDHHAADIEMVPGIE